MISRKDNMAKWYGVAMKIPLMNRKKRQLSLEFSAMADGPIPGMPGATWTISSGKAINTPTLGENLLPNGDMETGSPPTGWFGSFAVISSVDDPRSGAKAVNTKNEPTRTQGSVIGPTITSVVGKVYKILGYGKRLEVDQVFAQLITSAYSAISLSKYSTSESYDLLGAAGRATTTGIKFKFAGIDADAGEGNARFDDAAIYELVTSELYAKVPVALSDYVVCATIVVSNSDRGFPTGYALNLDSISNPQNGVFVWHDGIYAYVDELVAGTYTNRAKVTAWWDTAQEVLPLMAVKVGDSLRLFWGCAELGSAITLNAAVKDLKNIALYATHNTIGFKRFSAYPSADIKSCLFYGDSKTSDTTGYIQYVTGKNLAVKQSPTLIAAAGRTTAQAKAAVDAELAAASGTPEHILYNLGANDFSGIKVGTITEAAWKTNTAYILDAMHTKWASAKIYIMRPWVRTYDAEAVIVSGWINSVISTRAWCYLGPDEAVYLKGADDGVTNTSDGIHPNAVGRPLTGSEWRKAMGYIA